VVHPVADSDWYVMSQIDRDEVRAAAVEDALLLAAHRRLRPARGDGRGVPPARPGLARRRAAQGAGGDRAVCATWSCSIRCRESSDVIFAKDKPAAT
jgi:hypothetical protein